MALLVKFGQGFLPPQPANSLALEKGDFLRQAVNERIDWMPLTQEVFAKARRLDRPVMLVVGGAWSRDGRIVDRGVFLDEDLQTVLRRNFICVRVDVDEKPLWINAILPISRTKLATGPGFQIAFLSPQGALFDHYGRLGNVPTDPIVFAKQLNEIRENYDSSQATLVSKTSIQRADLNDLYDPRQSGPPDFIEWTTDLLTVVNSDTGGFTTSVGRLRPLAWRYLLCTGYMDDFKSSIDPVLKGAVVDWLDGGFFRGSRSVDWLSPEYDKLAVQNSDMMVTLAMAGEMTKNSYYSRIAKNTFDSLVSDFLRDGFIATARIGDEDRRGRSSRSSFHFPEIQTLWGSSLLSKEDAQWAAKNMGLDPRANRSMSIRVLDESLVSSPKFVDIIGKLRESRTKSPPKLTRRPTAMTNFKVVTALLRCARIWDDPERIRLAKELHAKLDIFRGIDDVTHFISSDLGSKPLLTEYLACSEASIEMYLLTGIRDELDTAVKVWSRARELFKDDNSALWFHALPSDDDSSIQDIKVPELVDNITESSTAQLIRVGYLLSVLTGEALNPAESTFHSLADSLAVIRLFGAISSQLSFNAAGFMLESLSVQDARSILVQGPDSLKVVRRLSAKYPTRLVAPVDKLRMPNLKNGIYILQGGTLSGPLTESELGGKLSAFLRSNPLSPELN